MHIIKCPTPRNFKNKTISLSPDQARAISVGDKLTIMRHDEDNEVFASVVVDTPMLNTLTNYGNFYTMCWSK